MDERTQEIWWEALGEILTDEIYDITDIDDYVGHLIVCIVDSDSLSEGDTDDIQIKSIVEFDQLEKLIHIAGQEEFEAMSAEYKERNLSEEDKAENADIVLYTDQWKYVTMLTVTRESMEERFE